jgi:hypothetical protein
MLSPNARAWKERIFSTTVRPKIGTKGALDKYFNSGPPNKAGTPRTCRSHYGTESKFGKVDTLGMDLIQNAEIQIDRKGISHFRMRRTHSVSLVQHSRYLLKAWRANCDVKLLLYFTNPTCPDLKISVDMLWRIPARDTIHLKTRKMQFRISSWGKYILVEIFRNWKNFQIAYLTKIVHFYFKHKMITQQV